MAFRNRVRLLSGVWIENTCFLLSNNYSKPSKGLSKSFGYAESEISDISAKPKQKEL
jgi:hypothetical protein